MSVLIFILATIGMSHIIVESEILASFRAAVRAHFGEASKITYMVNCYQCTGFWSGAFNSLMFWLFSISLTGLPVVLEQLVCGCAGGFLSMVGAALITFLDSRNQ